MENVAGAVQAVPSGQGSIDYFSTGRRGQSSFCRQADASDRATRAARERIMAGTPAPIATRCHQSSVI